MQAEPALVFAQRRISVVFFFDRKLQGRFRMEILSLYYHPQRSGDPIPLGKVVSGKRPA
jgi:hypothetical protein